jgi:hypothetical protein
MSENFYSAFLMGGLGNQMFQIAHAKAQGWKYNVDVSFFNDSFTPNQGFRTKKYINNIFKNIEFHNISRNTSRCNELSWNESKIVFNPKDSIEFYGYFQSSKNFLGYDEDIKTLFSPPISFLEKIKSKFPDTDFQNVVSIHMRRGDYQKFSDIHGIVDISYINHCMGQFGTEKKFFIFSDDINWVRQNIKHKNTTIIQGLDDYEELWLMSLCCDNIMSCSSFSWWGSFLNKNPNKKVMVPSVWFGPKGPQSYNNIYEKDWIKINVTYKKGFLIYEEN